MILCPLCLSTHVSPATPGSSTGSNGGGGAEASQYNKTLDEILIYEVLRPHRGDFLLNLAYECTPNFGEEFEQYLRQPLAMLSATPDEKVLYIYAKI